MRLDHLLSKEQLAAGFIGSVVELVLCCSDAIFTALCVVGGAHWWTLAFRVLDRSSCVSTAPPGRLPLLGVGGSDWVGKRVVGVKGLVGTLLGPETTSPVSVCAVPGCLSPLSGGGGWFRGGVCGCGGWCFGLAAHVGIPA